MAKISFGIAGQTFRVLFDRGAINPYSSQPSGVLRSFTPAPRNVGTIVPVNMPSGSGLGLTMPKLSLFGMRRV